jgi:hypothetical protein
MILFRRLIGSLAQEKFALSVFLEFEGAFDNKSFQSMDDAASDYGVCSTINRGIDFMLRSISFFCRYQGSKSAYKCAIRLYTRSVLSPLL